MIGPAGSIGNILATTPTPSGTPNYGGDTIRNDAQKKLLLLLADPSKASLFGTAGLPQLVLKDDGQPSSGDPRANDGIYSALFPGTNNEGHYRLQITVLGDSPQGKFQRTRTVTFFARPKPDAAQTKLTLVSSTPTTGGGKLIHLKLAPKDARGNFLGPDYVGPMQVTASGGRVEKPLQDNLDGSYEISFQLPPGNDDPELTVSVFGIVFIKTPLGSSGAAPNIPARVRPSGDSRDRPDRWTS
jgi:hypothetical protein